MLLIAGKVAWRIISGFVTVASFYSLFFGSEPESESIWRFSPWSMEAVYFSSGIVFLLALVASSLSVITPKVAPIATFLMSRKRERERLEETKRKDVLSTMKLLRAQCYYRVERKESAIGKYEEIHRVEMENLNLALPGCASPQQWVVYLDRIMPFVERHGLRLAKQESQKWKWPKPPPAVQDDAIPF